LARTISAGFAVARSNDGGAIWCAGVPSPNGLPARLIGHHASRSSRQAMRRHRVDDLHVHLGASSASGWQMLSMPRPKLSRRWPVTTRCLLRPLRKSSLPSSSRATGSAAVALRRLQQASMTVELATTRMVSAAMPSCSRLCRGAGVGAKWRPVVTLVGRLLISPGRGENRSRSAVPLRRGRR
jgi:hypothetical protein